MTRGRDAMGELLRGPEYEDEPSPAFVGVFSGTVSKVTAKGVFFTVPSFDRSSEFGPAPWPSLPRHDHNNPEGGSTGLSPDYGNPPKGTKVAVAFADGEADQPLILAVYGWPT